jgi:hypothetical protein
LARLYGKPNTEGMDIRSGMLVECETAGGGHVTMRALSGVVQGYDFPVVWVCTPEEYAQVEAVGTEPDRIPWPSSALQVLDEAQR